MRAVIIGSSRGFTRLSAEDSYPLYLTKTPYKDFSFLDWTINELKKINITEIIFIGGYHIEKIIKAYPNLKIIYNENWQTQNSISLLTLIKNINAKDTLVINSNILFRSFLLNNYINNKNNFIISNNKKFHLENSIIFLKKNSIKKLNKQKHPEKINTLIKLKNILGKGLKISKILEYENFSIFNNDESLARFILGTKAQTLLRLQTLINKANILPQYTVKYEDWSKSKTSIVIKIKKFFKGKKIVIRSSALSEDSWVESKAGSFKSFLDIDSNNSNEIEKNINEVFKSYSKSNSSDIKNEVLIQKFLINTKVSGVLFSVSNENSSPYYVINYDDTTGITDTVTSGTTSDTKTLFIYKNYKKIISINWIKKLLNVIKEIERKILYFKLDIEFAVDNKNNIFILQVRPLIINKKLRLFSNIDFDNEINSLHNFINNKIYYKENIFGNRTLFSNMTDWNPAEMIGTQPKPLDYSLYCHLITNKSWSIARKLMGYKDIPDKKLLVSLAGKPYIDVRRSFNSFLIPSLDNKLSSDLVNKEIKYLLSQPAEHDKVEFNVVVNCFYLDKKRMFSHLNKKLNLSKSQSSRIINLYSIWTNNFIKNHQLLFSKINKNYQNLNIDIENIKYSSRESLFELSSKLNQILEVCIKNGVIPFSIHARCGFIALQILQSFVLQKIFTKKDYDEILNNIPTISSKFNDDLQLFLNNKIRKEVFIKKYGHLRPSTYDIGSKNYKSLINENFFKKSSITIKSNNSKLSRAKKIWNKNIKNIQKKLTLEGFDINTDILFAFIYKSIQGRENGKYEFTKCINKVFEIIDLISKKINISISDLQFLPIEAYCNYEDTNFFNLNNLKKNIRYSKKQYYISSLIKLPSVINSEKDIYEIKQFSTIPNFITSNKIKGEVFDLKKFKKPSDISNKVVLIESADPGYDWIFSYNIAGLITKYGGAASHMAIRSAEYGIASIIGCGEDIFNEISNYNKIFIDCDQKIFRKLL